MNSQPQTLGRVAIGGSLNLLPQAFRDSVATAVALLAGVTMTPQRLSRPCFARL